MPWSTGRESAFFEKYRAASEDLGGSLLEYCVGTGVFF